MALSPSHWFGKAAVTFDSTLIGNSVWLEGAEEAGDSFTRTWGTPTDSTKWVWGTWIQFCRDASATAKRNQLFASGAGAHGFYMQLTSTGSNFQIFHRDGSGNEGAMNTTTKARDLGAWYHVLVDFNSGTATANNRINMYVDGVKTSTLSGTRPAADSTLQVNVDGQTARIGNDFSTTPGYHMKGYLAQTFFLDGHSIDADDIDITDLLDSYTFGTNGSQYVPISDEDMTTIVNAAGDNSFLLDYSDSGGTDAANLGNDISDNENDFTVNGMAASNQSTNTPSLAYPIMHPDSSGRFLVSDFALTLGNNLMTYSGSNSTPKGNFSSQAILSTDNPIYFEYYIKGGSVTDDGGRMGAGLFEQIFDQTSGMNAAGGESAFFYRGSLYDNGTDELASNWTTAQEDEIQNMAYKPSTGEVWIGVEGTWRNGSATDSTTLNIDNPDHTITASNDYVIGMGAARAADIGVINFGNNGTMSGNITAGGEVDGNGHGNFKHAVPSGFYAFNSANRVKPTYQGIDYFNTVLYTGNGTAIGSGGKAVTGANFEPGLVWIKNRDAADSHMLFDRVRTATKSIESDTVDVEATDTESLTAFGTDGFTVGDNVAVNTNTEDYVSWSWGTATGAGSTTSPAGSLASTSIVAGANHFSVVSYTGTGSATTVGHGLSAAPELIIVKNRDAADAWQVYHSGIASDAETDYAVFNTTAAAVDNADRWNDTAPTSSVFSIGDGDEVNTDTEKYIAYCFRSVAGVCKVGKYHGNGDANGPLICTEFKPSYIMFKKTSGTGGWYIYDTVRSINNETDDQLLADTTGVETTGSEEIDILSNGFKVTNADTESNAAGENYIYLAMAEIGGGGALPPIYGWASA